jgi:hypothetical protein
MTPAASRLSEVEREFQAHVLNLCLASVGQKPGDLTLCKNRLYASILAYAASREAGGFDMAANIVSNLCMEEGYHGNGDDPCAICAQAADEIRKASRAIALDRKYGIVRALRASSPSSSAPKVDHAASRDAGQGGSDE